MNNENELYLCGSDRDLARELISALNGFSKSANRICDAFADQGLLERLTDAVEAIAEDE
jgi:phage FluMu gp28-like protein